jgi:ribosomal protein S18 acetylase RimI-like enzyme
VNLALRPATAVDESFLYKLHRATMQGYIEEIWGEWDEDWQWAYFHQRFVAHDLQIIQLDGSAIGVISIQERTEELFLGILQILPMYQRQGIGTALLNGLLISAGLKGKAVALKVLKSNRAARSLYQRLGFGVTGETDTHYIMAWMNSKPNG